MIRIILDRPWGITGLSTALWIERVCVQSVPIRDIVATQQHLDFPALIAEPATRDPFPHIVKWNGTLYLEDGHHRLARAILRGEETIEARVYSMGESVSGHL